jgi:glucosamine-6-phosphate deaminase
MTPVVVHPAAAELGRALADRIVREIDAGAGRPYLLGCPAGRSLASTYEALAARRDADLGRLVIVMMDEYVHRRAERFERCSVAEHYSCARFAEHAIRRPLGLREDQVWLPDPADPGAYERRLAEAGGIDLFLLASGASDGHVAFNPPGAALESRTRIVPIAEATRRDNMGTFPDFRSLDEVPTHGVSIGLGTIVTHARSSVMVIHGAHKAAAARRLVTHQAFTPAWPATVIHCCRAASIHVDAAAAEEMHR